MLYLFRYISTTQYQRITFFMPFRPFSDYKYRTNLPMYDVHITLLGSVRIFGLLVCGPDLKEEK